MKYLNSAQVDTLNAHYLSSLDLGDTLLSANIQVYSCKYVRAEASLKLQLQQRYSSSPQQCHIGKLALPETRSTLFHLISTLNWAFQDFDFAHVEPAHFEKINSFEELRARVNEDLVIPVSMAYPGFRSTFWNLIDSESVEISSCEYFVD
jgi:hypothetical protein